MATDEDDLAFLIASSKRLVGRLRREPSFELPSDRRGGALAEHVRETLDALAAAAAEAEQDFQRAVLDAARRTALRNLRFYNMLTWAVHEAAPWLDRDRHHLGLGTTYFLDEIALAMIGPGIDLVPVEKTDYMYSVLSWPFRWIIEEKLGRQAQASRDPIVVAYPAQEVDAVLLHCAFAHEMGHPACDVYDLVDEVVAPLSATKSYGRSCDAAVDYLEQRYGVPPVKGRARVRQRLEYWVEELLCDQLAFAYLGPSFLFTFAAFLLSVIADEAGEEHPPTTMRVQLLLEEARHRGWDETVRSRFPSIWAWLEDASATTTSPAAPDLRFVSEMAQAAARRIRTAARKRLDRANFQPAEYDALADELHELLRFRILPIEGSAGRFPRRDVMLAAWIDAIEAAGGTPAALSEAVADPELRRAAGLDPEFQRFVGKSLELGVIAETWAGLP